MCFNLESYQCFRTSGVLYDCTMHLVPTLHLADVFSVFLDNDFCLSVLFALPEFIGEESMVQLDMSARIVCALYVIA